MYSIEKTLFSTNLKVVVLEVGPEELRKLGAGGHLNADDLGELGAELLRCGEAFSGGHGEIWMNLVVLELDGRRVEERLSFNLRMRNVAAVWRWLRIRTWGHDDSN